MDNRQQSSDEDEFTDIIELANQERIDEERKIAETEEKLANAKASAISAFCAGLEDSDINMTNSMRNDSMAEDFRNESTTIDDSQTNFEKQIEEDRKIAADEKKEKEKQEREF